MTVIEKEIERCKEILPTLKGNQELQEAMEDRIDILKMKAESIQSDI